ncbi:MAG: hypothetical protein P9X22_01085 [Candidatus Zapsychrus exili]|nr:hypothetical protein [Candidatus Zapsychrus exili]
MSIIHDALKKVQHNLKKKQDEYPIKNEHMASQIDGISQTTEPPEIDTNPKNEQKKTNTSKRTTMLLVLLIITIVYFSKELKLMPNNNIFQKPIDIIQKAVIINNDIPVAEQIQKDLQPELKLTGTMLIEEKVVALINGEIYNIGDAIENGNIINITLDKVDIDYSGKTTTLYVGKNY